MMPACAAAIVKLPAVVVLTVRLMVAVVCRLPEVPVIVMLEVPVAAKLDAVSVSVLAEVEALGAKLAATPLGNTVAARATAPTNPFNGFTAIVLVMTPPRARFRLAGVADKVNDGGPVIVSDIRAVLVRLPDVPVIVRVDVDAAAELEATTVSVLVVAALAGLNDPVTPVGNPAIARFTAPLKPCCGLMVMVLVPLAPGAMESVDADEDRLKAGEFDVAVKLLIKPWPAGVPHPVTRS